MEHDAFDMATYLKRIGLAKIGGPTIGTLEALHRAQAYTIPFENFSIFMGDGIDLSPGTIFNKLVNRKRGGYCFELNSLFA